MKPKLNTASAESKTPLALLSSAATPVRTTVAGWMTPILVARTVGGGGGPGGDTLPDTTMPLCVPLMVGTATSLAVSDWVPCVWNVAVKVPRPLVSIASAGSVAAGSLLEKVTVPEYVGTTMP